MPKHNIYDFDQLYRRTKTGTGVTGKLVRLRLGPVGAKTLRVLSRVTVENKTSPYTKCRLGINSGSRDLYIDELITIPVNVLAVSRSEIQLGEGDYFFAELTGTVDNDELVMTAIGRSKSL